MEEKLRNIIEESKFDYKKCTEVIVAINNTLDENKVNVKERTFIFGSLTLINTSVFANSIKEKEE